MIFVFLSAAHTLLSLANGRIPQALKLLGGNAALLRDTLALLPDETQRLAAVAALTVSTANVVS